MIKRIGIIDYGVGNLFSVAAACKNAGAQPEFISEPNNFAEYHGLILPGVGAFGTAAKTLQARGLFAAISRYVEAGRPLLGVCLGMQLLMTDSFELGHNSGFNFISGSVRGLRELSARSTTIKVPHIGWNNVNWDHDALPAHPLLRDLRSGDEFYFVHSFVTVPENPEVIAADTNYEDYTFCSIVHKDNIVGTQFHPEKSGRVGLIFYRNWIEQIGKA